jgi:ATP synthase protein I
MSEDPPSDSLKDLETRLKHLRDETRPREPRGGANQPASGMGTAFTIAAHLVAGLGVGAFLGYWLDRWLGTSPWLLIVLFFLGAAAGMMNVYRMVTGMDMAAGYRPPAGKKQNDRRAKEDLAVPVEQDKSGDRSGQSD